MGEAENFNYLLQESVCCGDIDVTGKVAEAKNYFVWLNFISCMHRNKPIHSTLKLKISNHFHV